MILVILIMLMPLCATLFCSHCSEVMCFVVIIVILSELLQTVVFRDVICSLLEYYQCFRADCLCCQVHPFRLPSCVCLITIYQATWAWGSVVVKALRY